MPTTESFSNNPIGKKEKSQVAMELAALLAIQWCMY